MSLNLLEGLTAHQHLNNGRQVPSPRKARISTFGVLGHDNQAVQAINHGIASAT